MKKNGKMEGFSASSLEFVALLPGYLARRQQDLNRINELYRETKIYEIARIAHKMKGTGTGYGLPELSRLANNLEKAVKANDETAMKTSIEKLEKLIGNELEKLVVRSVA